MAWVDRPKVSTILKRTNEVKLNPPVLILWTQPFVVWYPKSSSQESILPKKLTPADFVIQQFGGVRATAYAIGLSPSSVCFWRSKHGPNGRVPETSHARILKAAKRLKLKIKAVDLAVTKSIS